MPPASVTVQLFKWVHEWASLLTPSLNRAAGLSPPPEAAAHQAERLCCRGERTSPAKRTPPKQPSPALLLIMQASFLSFVLIAVRLFVPLDCTMRPREPEAHLRLQRKPASSVGFSQSEKKGLHSPLLSKSDHILLLSHRLSLAYF